jgi:uncharacterized phage protein (TIGR02220 family)
MAERRMFAKTIIDSDAFLDMPLSTQALYFHLSMRADDDGFINNAKKIQRLLGCADDDLKILLAKNFIIPFETGVCVIKHWKIHNLIQKDRYKPTVYEELKQKLLLKNNNVYTLDTPCIQHVSKTEPQVSIGKVSLGKVSLDKTLCEEVFEYWSQIMNHSKAIMDSKRRRVIDARLKEGYSVEQLKQAIDGCKASSFHQGQNDRQQIYDDIELICRSASNVDKFIQISEKPVSNLSANGKATMDALNRWMEKTSDE